MKRNFLGVDVRVYVSFFNVVKDLLLSPCPSPVMYQ